jgi:hypothetical protein
MTNSNTAVDHAAWAMYVNVTKGQEQTEWVVYPPRPSDGHVQSMKRRHQYDGHRPKWKWYQSDPEVMAAKVSDQLQAYANQGWIVNGPIVVPVQADDLAKARMLETPYKLLRHFKSASKKLGWEIP